MPKIVLGYWKIRSRGQVARHLLFYCGAEWEEKYYNQPEQWFDEDKLNLGLPLPNLPYLIVDGFQLTQSYAIYKYIVKYFKKPELLGKTIEDEGRVDSLLGAIYDVDTNLIGLSWDPEGKQKMGDALIKVEPKLAQIQKIYLEKNFALEYPTISDFVIAEFSYYLENMSPETYQKYPFLKNVRDGINNLPQIKQYYTKDFALKGPFIVDGDFAF